MPWPSNRSKAGSDLVLLQTFLAFHVQIVVFSRYPSREHDHLRMKNKKVCNKTRSPPALLLFNGQGTEHKTVKWSVELTPQKLHCTSPF